MRTMLFLLYEIIFRMNVWDEIEDWETGAGEQSKFKELILKML